MDRNEEVEIEMFNGFCVINSLASQKHGVTENDLLECFITSGNNSRSLVQQELKCILDKGVRSGFILRKGNKYAIRNFKRMYDTDGDDRCAGSPMDTSETINHISLTTSSSPIEITSDDNEEEECETSTSTSPADDANVRILTISSFEDEEELPMSLNPDSTDDGGVSVNVSPNGPSAIANSLLQRALTRRGDTNDTSCSTPTRRKRSLCESVEDEEPPTKRCRSP